MMDSMDWIWVGIAMGILLSVYGAQRYAYKTYREVEKLNQALREFLESRPPAA